MISITDFISLADLSTAVLIGLAGSSHCLFMCGGIQGAMATSSSPSISLTTLFSFGRIASYALIGLLAGSLGFALQSMHSMVIPVAKIVAGLLLLAMAAYLGRWWSGLVVLEKIGAPIWSIIQPFARQFMPVKSASGALIAGAIWGWLPCGLVYSTLAWAMLAENPANAALRMFFFGLGTIPALLGSGLLAGKMAHYLKSRLARNINASLLVIFALWTMLPAIKMLGSPDAHIHDDHHHESHSNSPPQSHC